MRQRYRYRENQQFAGAIKKDKHVLALDRKLQWRLAQILEVRYELAQDEDAIFIDPYIGDDTREGDQPA